MPYPHREKGGPGEGGANPFEGKSADEIAALIAEKHNAYDLAIEEKASKEELKGIRQDIADLIAKQYKALEDIVKTQGEVIAKMETGGPNTEPTSFKSVAEAITHSVMKSGENGAPSVKDQIDAIVKAGGKQTEPLAFKVAVTMTTENTIGSGATQYLLTEFTGIYSRIRKRELRYLANVSVGRIGNQRALWVEEMDEQGTPIFIGEGDTKTQLSSIWQERNKDVKKIAVYGKVTTEMMADLPQLIAYIQNNMMRRMDIAIEDQLFSGNDTGDNLAGLSEFATAFSAGDLAATVTTPNELDVLEAIALQVEVAHGISSGIFIHPSTMSKIKLIKDSTGRPIWKDYVITNGFLEVSGQRIIPTTAVTAGTFIGGELEVINVLIREELGIQIGLNGNDFIENKKTMLMEKRLVQFVSANDTPVLVQGEFADAITDLTAPPAV